MKNKIVLKSAIVATCVILVAFIGGIFTNSGMDWYESLNKPTQWPPKFLFPLVWTIIYVLSFIIMFLLIKNENKSNKKVFTIFAINGILNVLWCIVFFGLQQLFLGQVIIILNLIMSFILLIELENIKDIYFYLLSIYPIWLSIATTLNLATWILN